MGVMVYIRIMGNAGFISSTVIPLFNVLYLPSLNNCQETHVPRIRTAGIWVADFLA